MLKNFVIVLAKAWRVPGATLLDWQTGKAHCVLSQSATEAQRVVHG